MDPAIKRKRGRPRGVKNGQGSLGKWEPKTWKPLYTQVVAAVYLGNLSQVAAAKYFSLTPGQINNIVTCKQAIAIRQLLIAKGLSIAESTLETRMKHIQEKAFARVESYITDDANYEKRPTEVVDRSFKLLMSQGVLKDSEKPQNNVTINNINSDKSLFVLDPQRAQTLVDGLNKSEEARLLNAGESGADRR